MMFETAATLRALELEPAGADRYRATSVPSPGPVVFGGQLLAQSMAAALIGHEDKTVQTLHTVFARAATSEQPLEILVDPMHSGRRLASSSVTVRQGDRLCARSLVLMAVDEPDLIHHDDGVEVRPPAPAGDVAPDGGVAGWETRIVGEVDLGDPEAVGPPELGVWTRWAGAPSSPLADQALVAFSTEPFLIATAMRPHAGVGQSQAHVTLSTGVITHTLTFHEPHPAAEWALLKMRSSYAGHGRCYGRGEVIRPDGRLAASFVQDGMIRAMSPGRGGGL